jgi:hypothetical protein
MGGLIGYASFSPQWEFSQQVLPDSCFHCRELAGQAFNASRLTCPR